MHDILAQGIAGVMMQILVALRFLWTLDLASQQVVVTSAHPCAPK
ncbi:hypothetical protein [Ktedonobacter robiniae]